MRMDLQRENEVLKSENEALKLKLFWKEYGPKQLNAAMSAANQVKGGPECYCLPCALTGRYEGQYWEPKEYCAFKEWFEKVLTDHEMSIGEGTPDVPISDHHFSNLSGGIWLRWTYGSRLRKARSVRDPELAKLKSLFKTLNIVNHA